MRNSLSGVRARRQGVDCCAKQYAVWYAQIKAQYVEYTDSQRGNRDPDSQCTDLIYEARESEMRTKKILT